MNIFPRHRAIVAASLVPTPPPGQYVTRGDQRLDDATVERLAVALHERYHGEHPHPGVTEAECARLAGAYDDVYVLEPLIVDLLKREPA